MTPQKIMHILFSLLFSVVKRFKEMFSISESACINLNNQDPKSVHHTHHSCEFAK